MRASPSFAVAATWVLPAPAPLLPAVAAAFRIERRLRPGRGAVALTFDDGPHPEGTPAVLELLRDAGVRATFFVVGEQVERYPEVVRAIVSDGHEVALHGYRHRLLLRRSIRDVADDLERCSDLVARTAGRRPSCYRPPYGVFSSGALALVRDRGWRPVVWSRWGRDWSRRATPAAISARASAGLAAGDIVLLHDADHYAAPGSWRNTVAALPAILERASALGLPWETIG